MNSHDVLFHLAGTNLSGVPTRATGDRSSIASTSTASTTGSFSLATTPTKMDIRVDHHFQAKVYTSGDGLTGTVTVTPQRAVPFDNVEIALVGTIYTAADHTVKRVATSHVFLKMIMPPDELAAAYPTPRVLDAGHAYAFPFHFVLPHQLTLGACRHAAADDTVRAHHLRMPPTLGGDRWERDDMSPDMVRVEYAIKARIWRYATGASGHDKASLTGRTKIVEAVHPLRVLPVSAPDPALQQLVTTPAMTKAGTDTHRYYKLQSTKTLRKGLLGGKQGRLTVAAGDGELAPMPAPLVVRPDSGSSAAAAATAAGGSTAHVHLHFQPVTPDTPPPQITGVTAKLGVHTFFSPYGTDVLPDRGDWTGHDGALLTDLRGCYSTSVTLPLPAAAAQAVLRGFRWEPHVDDAPVTRTDSGYCSGSSSGSEGEPLSSPKSPKSPTSSKAKTDIALSYSGRLALPIDLPLHKKTFVPTFHACVASRVYVLHLAVSVVPGSKKSSLSSSSAAATPSVLSTTTFDMAIPIQIAVAPSRAAAAAAAAAEANRAVDTAGLPSFEDALEDAAADAHLQPRVLAVPDQQYQATSQLPGYQR